MGKYKLEKREKIEYLNSVVFFNIWVGVSECPSVVGNHKWNLVWSHSLSLNLAEVEFSFIGINFVGLESSFDIIKNSEKVTGLIQRNNVHHSKGISGVFSDLIVNFDETFLILNNTVDILS